MAVGCTFSQVNDQAGAFVGGIGGGAGATTIYVDCYFDGSFACSGGIGIVITVKHIDTRCAGAVTVSDHVDFLWEGGEVAGNIIVRGSTTKSSWAGRFKGSVTVGADTVGYDHVVTNTGGIGGGVTVSSIACAVSINGDWTGVTFSGTPTGMRRFDGSSSDIDFTGPGHVNVTKYTLGGGTKITLRGSAVTCFGEVQAGGALSAVSLTHSLIVLGFGATGSFTLDAGSSHNLAVIGGTHQGTWGGTTNLGAFNRIITEIDDTLISGSSSALINLIQSVAGAGLTDPTPDFGVEYVAGPPGKDGVNGTNGAAGAAGTPGPPTNVWETTPDYPAIEYIPGPPGKDGVNGTNGTGGGATLSAPGMLEDYEIAEMAQRILGDPPGPPAVAPTGVVPGTILATTQYQPVSPATYNFVKTTITELDTTNLTITFIAPRNGIVNIVVSCVAQIVPSATLATSGFLALFDHTSHAVVGSPSELIGRPALVTSDSTVLYVSMTFHLTGLSEGSHTLDLAGGSTTGAGTVSVFAQINSSKTVGSDAISPLIIQAIASV